MFLTCWALGLCLLHYPGGAWWKLCGGDTGWRKGTFGQAIVSKFCNELTIFTLLVVISPCAQALHGVELLILLWRAVFWGYLRVGLWLCWSMRWGFPHASYQQGCCVAVPSAALAQGVSSAEQDQAPVQRCPTVLSAAGTWVVRVGREESGATLASCTHVLLSWHFACWLCSGTTSVKGRLLESWNRGCQGMQSTWCCMRGADVAQLGALWRCVPGCQPGSPLPARDPPCLLSLLQCSLPHRGSGASPVPAPVGMALGRVDATCRAHFALAPSQDSLAEQVRVYGAGLRGGHGVLCGSWAKGSLGGFVMCTCTCWSPALTRDLGLQGDPGRGELTAPHQSTELGRGRRDFTPHHFYKQIY